VNVFDTEIITFVNQLSRLSWTVDASIALLAKNNLFKGGVLVTLLWWSWFNNNESRSLKHKYVISTLLSCMFAVAIARALALTLPFRNRPLHEQDLDFEIPQSITSNVLQGMSSFPSDHAVLFFSISAGLLFVSRGLGIFAILYTVIFIALPRIYLGYHYPTDILVGALIGITVCWIGNIFFVRTTAVETISSWSVSKPAFFYALFFIVSFEVANLFGNSRSIMLFVYTVFRNIFT